MLLMISGNMWAQTWNNIEDLVQPYDSSAPVNATPALQQVSVCFFCGRLCWLVDSQTELPTLC